MTGTATPVEVARGTALDWVRDSLLRGGPIAKHALPVLASKPGRFFVIAPAEPEFRVGALGAGGVMRSSVADMALAKKINHLKNSGARVLCIEDNLRLPGDRALKEHFSQYRVIEGSVVHWQLLSAIDGTEAVKLIRAASNGYPLNAFVGWASPDTADTKDRDAVDFAAEISSIRLSIIVSAFDGESFLMWNAIERGAEDSPS